MSIKRFVGPVMFGLAILVAGPGLTRAQTSNPKITASWAGNGKIKVVGSGFYIDNDDGAEVVLELDQNGVDSGDLPQGYDNFSANPDRGTFGGANDPNQCQGALSFDFEEFEVDHNVTACGFPVLITAACLVGITAQDVPTGNFSNSLNVKIPASGCPGPKLTAKFVKGAQPTVVVSGTGFTPGFEVAVEADQDLAGGPVLGSASPTASGTLKPGPYPTATGGRFQVTFPAVCHHNTVISALDTATDVIPAAIIVKPGC